MCPALSSPAAAASAPRRPGSCYPSATLPPDSYCLPRRSMQPGSSSYPQFATGLIPSNSAVRFHELHASGRMDRPESASTSNLELWTSAESLHDRVRPLSPALDPGAAVGCKCAETESPPPGRVARAWTVARPAATLQSPGRAEICISIYAYTLRRKGPCHACNHCCSFAGRLRVSLLRANCRTGRIHRGTGCRGCGRNGQP